MKKRFARIIRYGRISLFTALLPVVTFAQSGNTTFQNPTSKAGINDIQSFIAAFLKAIVQISLPILTLFIVYAGFKFVFARGKPEGITEAKRNFLYVILGAILILGAWVLASLISTTASQVLGQQVGV
jgi:heme/copper-type cytochrome/quinol oxidase subunit 2